MFHIVKSAFDSETPESDIENVPQTELTNKKLDGHS